MNNNITQQLLYVSELIRVKSAVSSALITTSLAFFLESPHIFELSLTMFCIVAYGMAINEYFDYEKDLLCPKRHVIANGKVSRNMALNLSIALFVTAIIASKNLMLFQWALATAILVMLSIYSFINNRYGVLANFIVASCTSISILMSQTTLEVSLVSLSSLCAFFIIMSREITLDIHDYDADFAIGKSSFPILLNKQSAFLIAIGSSLVSMVLGIIMGLYYQRWIYLSLVVAINVIYLHYLLKYRSAMDETSFDNFVEWSRGVFLLLVPAVIINF